MSLFAVLGLRYAWATVPGDGGPSRDRKAGASKPLWSRGEFQNETLVQLYFHLMTLVRTDARGKPRRRSDVPHGPRHCARAITALAKYPSRLYASMILFIIQLA
jgi:hypothetical protein